MNDPEPDGVEIELSATNASSAPGQADASTLPARSALVGRLSRRQRATRLIGAGSVILAAVLVIVASSPSLRDGVLAPFTGQRAPAAAQSYYIDDGVPWATITLDGQPVHPPLIEVEAPIDLLPGHHRLEWRGDPFEPQHCTISVPAERGDTCTLGALSVGRGYPEPLAQVILLRESLAALPPDQRARLIDAMQAALDAHHASATIQPGERYATKTTGIISATQAMRATLTFQVIAGDNQRIACQFNAFETDMRPCEIDVQSCFQLCTVPWDPLTARQGQTATGSEAAWFALAVTQPTWDYATADGRVIAANQPIDLTGAASIGHMAELRIGWSDSTWQVSALFGADLHGQLALTYGGIHVANDPPCAAAQDLFAHTQLGEASNTQVRSISGPNPSAGCLIVTGTGGAQSGMPGAVGATQAWYLERYGVLLAANDRAHRADIAAHYGPTLPVADAYEQAVARALAALPGQVIRVA